MTCLHEKLFRLSAEDCCPLFRRITNTITYEAFNFVDCTTRPVEEEMIVFILLGWTQLSTTICTRLPPYPFLLQCVVARVWYVSRLAYPLPLAQWVPWPLLSSLTLLSIVYISWTNTLMSQCNYTISLPWQFYHHHRPYRKCTFREGTKTELLDVRKTLIYCLLCGLCITTSHGDSPRAQIVRCRQEYTSIQSGPSRRSQPQASP